MHGGPPSALLARAIESFRPDGGSAPVLADRPFVARLTVELLRPIPAHPLRIGIELTRPGKKVQLVQASLFGGADGSLEVARAVGLRLRRQSLSLPPEAQRANAAADAAARPPGRPGDGVPPSIRPGQERGFFAEAAELRFLSGGPMVPGPGMAWVRLLYPIVDDEEPTPFVRTAALADFGNAMGAILSGDQFAHPNADLTISLHREPVGDWVCLDGVTRIGPDGIGLASCALHDLVGPIGRTEQSLVVSDLRG